MIRENPCLTDRLIRMNVFNQYLEFFKTPAKRDAGLFLALTLTPISLLHNHVWGLGNTKNVSVAEALRVSITPIDRRRNAYDFAVASAC